MSTSEQGSSASSQVLRALSLPSGGDFSLSTGLSDGSPLSPSTSSAFSSCFLFAAPGFKSSAVNVICFLSSTTPLFVLDLAAFVCRGFVTASWVGITSDRNSRLSIRATALAIYLSALRISARVAISVPTSLYCSVFLGFLSVDSALRPCSAMY